MSLRALGKVKISLVCGTWGQAAILPQAFHMISGWLSMLWSRGASAGLTSPSVSSEAQNRTERSLSYQKEEGGITQETRLCLPSV